MKKYLKLNKVVWANEPPLTTNIVMELLGNEKEWKAPTVISLLLRLAERGFLKTENKGKERTYFPLVTSDDYLKVDFCISPSKVSFGFGGSSFNVYIVMAKKYFVRFSTIVPTN